MDTCFELSLIQGNQKCHCSPPVRAGSYSDQVMHGVLAKVHLTVGPVSPWTHSVIIFPVLEYIIEIDFSQLVDPHISSLGWSEIYNGRKGQAEATIIPST